MTLKKALVAITVVAMLFGMVSTAFAGFADISDSKTAAAATRLSALGIINGFPDGTFGASANITRAQFAAIAVRALNLQAAADYAKGATRFSDVAADHWASGYVNIATQQGVINGYPDGTFGPEKQVTYAEAVTMIVRLLGYGPAVEGRGTWPANYITKATQLGFTTGIAFNGAAPATRGDIALFVDNSLTIKMMVEAGIGSNGQPSYIVGTDRLIDLLGATKTVGWLTDSPELFTNLSGGIHVDDGSATGVDLDINGASFGGLVGHQVRAWSNADGAFLIEDLSSATAATFDGANFVVGDKTYDPADFTVIRNFGATGAGTLTADDTVELTFSGTTPKYAIATLYDDALVVKSVSTTFKNITFVSGAPLDLNGLTATFVGAASKLEEVKADDVIETITSGTDVLVNVTRDAKSGTLSKIAAGKFYVDGVAYATAIDTATYADSLGKTITVLLNKAGDVIYVKGVTAAVVATNYAVTYADAVVVPTIDGNTLYVKVMKADGTKATIQVADGAETDAAATPRTWDNSATDAGTVTDFAAGTLVSYKLDADGMISSIVKLVAAAAVVDTWTVEKATHTLYDGTSVRVALGTTAPIFTYVASKAGTTTRTSVEGYASVDAYVFAANNVVKAVLVTDSALGTVTADTYGMYAGKYQTADGYFVTINNGSAAADYSVSKTIYDATTYTAKTVVTFKADGSTITALSSESATDADQVVVGVDATNGIIEVGTVTGGVVTVTATYFTTSDTLFFNVKSGIVAGNIGGIAEGATIDVYHTSGIADVIVVK